MMLQQKLVIGVAACLVSSIALATNPVQTAKPVKTSTSQQSRQASTVNQSKQEQQPQESVLLPGTRLVAGEAENEFYILDKNDPMPVKAVTWKAFEAVANNENGKPAEPEAGDKAEKIADSDVESLHEAMTNKVFDDVAWTEKGSKVKTQSLFSKEAFEDAVNEQDSEETAAPVSQDNRDHAANRKAVLHKLTAIRLVRTHHAVAVHQKAVSIHAKFRLAKMKISRQLDIKRMVDSVQVIKHASLQSRKLTSGKAVPYVVAVSKAKHKVISRKQKHAKVEVAMNETSHVQASTAISASDIY